MKIEGNLFIPTKKKYVRRKKKEGECILCSVASKDPKVHNLEIYRDELFFVTANLYPYNPGHIMIVPIRHIVDIRELNKKEILGLAKIQNISLNILEKVYRPSGFNIGFNIGKYSGASISHLHLHIVPRFINELGFVEIVSGSRIIIEDPYKMVRNLRRFYKREKTLD